jgi:hypothetical protein
VSYYLFLDDIRDPVSVTWVRLPNVDQSDWKIVRDYQEFASCIMAHGIPKFIAFDHDLADEHYFSTGYCGSSYVEKTGYDCAKYLADYCQTNMLSIPEYVVHSMNPAGKENIIKYLENAKKYIG